ncbi:MAG: cell division protein ZapB [Candidatus Micrarchaeota archaeon]|nr:cell division protein ZapB [Candidatus Micrarchaeota archaeon]
MPDEVNVIEPKTDEITLKGSLSGSFEQIQARLSPLQLFTTDITPDGLTVLRVESRDIQKRPFLFIIITLGRDKASIRYTIGLDSSPKMRRLYVLKTLLSVLSLVTDLYHVDDTEIFQHLDSSIDEVLGSVSQSYSTLFNNYDSLFNEFRELKRRNIELASSNKNLTVQASQLSDENQELKTRLKSLETYSDEALMVMIEDWIESHDNTIDVNGFANNYKIVPTRVEEMLNKMVSLNYIELKG